MTDRTVSVALKMAAQDYIANAGKAKAATADLAKAQDSAAKVAATSAKAHEDAWKKIGNVTAIAGGLVLAGVGKAVGAFADFDAKMSAAQAATGATGESLDRLRQLAIKMGADTMYSASDAADAITEMGKAGVSTSDIMSGGLAGALSLAAAGQLEVGRAGEIAATAMNQFGLAGRDLPHVADLLAAAAGKAQGSVEDVANAMKYVGPVAKSMNISIEETTGVIGEFAAQGILGEQAGTSLRGVLLSLSAPSKIAQDTMTQFGISLYDANGHVKNLASIAQSLHDRLGNLDEATRNAALGQIFGNAQITAATILYQGGAKAVQDWTNKVNDAGFAQKQAAQLTDNLKGDIERLSGSIDTVFIQSGSSVNATLRSLTQGAESFVNTMGELPGPVLLGGTALTGLALILPKGIQFFKDYQKTLNDAGLTMERLSEKAPRLASSLGKTATVAKGLGVAFTALAVSSHVLDSGIDTLGVQQLGNDLNNSTDAVTTLNQAFAGAVGTGTDFDSNVKSLGDALRYTFDPGFLDSADQTAGSIFATFGGNNTSDIHVAATRLNEVDQALSSLVSNGDTVQAANAMAQIEQAAQRQGVSLDDLKKKFPGYYEALASANAQTAAMGDSMTKTAVETDAAAKATISYSDALKQLTSPTLDARAAEDKWWSSIDAATQALKDNGKTLDVHTDKGRQNREALDAMAQAAIDQIGALEQNGASQAQLDKTLDTSRATLESTAIQFGMTKGQAKAYADQVLSTPKSVHTDIALNTAQATTALSGFLSNLQRINGTTVTTYINTQVLGSARKLAAADVAGAGAITRADGGYIAGAGTATSDSIPAYLSNGEYVVKAAAVARYGRTFFDTVNAMHFASGGMVGAATAAPSSVVITGAQITGTLDTPFGPAQVRGEIRQAFIDQAREMRAGIR